MPLPAEDATFSLAQATRDAGVTLRTVRYYSERRMLPQAEFRSKHTRYDRAYLIRLRAIKHLRDRNLRLEAIRARLDAASFEELVQLAGYIAPAPAAPSTAGATSEQAGSSPAPADDAVAARPLAAGFLGPYRTGTAHPSERWEHHDVCPGVKLLVRTEADPEAWRVAREMLATFAARG